MGALGLLRVPVHPFLPHPSPTHSCPYPYTSIYLKYEGQSKSVTFQMVCIETLASPSHNVIGGVDANCNNASERPRVHSTPIRVGKGIHAYNKLAWFPQVAGQVERERRERGEDGV